MKITRIKACNLASLAGVVELDLLKGSLGQAGLFAITGPTGSGKTTILDAACLALFDQTPRLAEADRRVKISRQGSGLEGIGARSPLSLLRHDAGSGYAEVDFEGVDGRPFTARWEVRRAGDKPSGRLQAQKMRLIDRITQLELGSGTKRETLSLIEEHLGLSFEQFTRSVLLAQGQFASFLKASRNTRAELLERMTGTDLYAQISIQAFNRHKDSKEKLDALQAEQQSLHLLTPLEQAALAAELAALKVQLESLNREQQARSTYAQWTKSCASAQHAMQSAAALADKAAEAWDKAEPERERLAQFKESAPQRTALVAAKLARSALADAQTGHSTAQAKLRDVGAARAAAVAELERCKQAHAESVEERGYRLPRLEQVKALNTRLEQTQGEHLRAQATLSQAQQDLAQRRAALASLRDRAQTHKDALVAAQAELELLPQALALLPLWERVRADLSELNQLAADLRTQDPKRLHQASAALEDGRKAAQAAKATRSTLRARQQALLGAPPPKPHGAKTALDALLLEAERWRAYLQRRADLTAEEQAAREALEHGQAGAAELGKRAAALEQGLPELRRVRLRSRELRALGESTLSLQAHRARLIPGEPCPLCGSAEHPGVDPTLVLLNELEEQEQAAAQALMDAEGACKALRLRLSERNEALSAQGEQLQSLKDALAEHRIGESMLRAAIGDPSTLQAREAALREAVEAQTLERARWEQARAELHAELSMAERAVDIADQTVQSAQLALDQARQADAQRAQAQTRAEGLRARMGQELAAVPGFAAGKLDKPGALLDRWRAQVSRAQASQGQADAQGAALQELQAPLALAQERMQHAQSAEALALQGAQSLQASLDALDVEKTALGIPDPEAEAADLERAVTQSAQGMELARERAEDLRVAVERSEIRAQERAAAQAKAAGALDAAEATLRQAMGTLSLGELEGLLNWPREHRLQVEVQVSSLRTQLERSSTVHQERAEALAALQANPPSAPPSQDDGGPTLQEQLNRTHKRVVELEMRLAQHAGDQAQAERLLTQISEHQAASRKWAVLKELIGSANGDTFRQFAQGLTLETLLGHANTHLAELAPRYRLARVPGEDLELQIIDQALAGDVRSVNSLSGGETFLTSLALALGLASLSSSKTPVRTLFIDEGFGSLDPKSLDTALATLDALQAGGRQVGIISHVAGIGDHIGVQVRVKPIAPGKSQVLVP